MKDWFQKNQWLGRFVIATGGATLLALVLLFLAKGRYEDASARFNEASMERSRLERLDPFPSDANYNKMKQYIENYGAALDKFKTELKTHVPPAPAELAPNEFQSRLRQAMTATVDKARANKVELPENFFLGFDEFTAALPNTAVAPLLGQELSQIQLLMNIVIDARVDRVIAFKRTPLPSEGAAAPTPAAGPGKKPGPTTAGSRGESAKLIERGVVDLTFTGTPGAARRVINQIASANDQFYIIRTLHVRNENDKGPLREAAAAPAPDGTSSSPQSALNFIVGNEQVEIAAKIEIVRFTY